MTVIDGRVVKFSDWVAESTLGTTPTNPTMISWPGELIDIEITSAMEVDSYNVLAGASVTDPLSSGQATKTGESHKAKATTKPSTLTWLPYALMAATSATYATGKVQHPRTIGVKADSEYCTLTGSVLSEFVWDFPDTKTANVLTQTFECVDKTDWSSSDYIGTGSHATPSSTDPYTMSDLSSILYDGADPDVANIIIESVKITMTYKLEPIKDLSVSVPSKIGDFAYLSREIKLELKVTLMEMSAHDDILSDSDHTFAFTLDGKTFTFSAIKWTNGPAVSLAPASKVGFSLTSDGMATRLAIA